MTNKEAIKFLQQLYPNGGHCWLDEQRIEAIGMAIKALQQPVSEDLEEAVNAYIGYAPEVDESSSTYGKRQAFKAGAKWQENKDQKSMEIMDEVYFKSCDMIRKQMIDKACKYLQDHREEVETEDNGISGWISDEFIEKFSKYLEE